MNKDILIFSSIDPCLEFHLLSDKYFIELPLYIFGINN